MNILRFMIPKSSVEYIYENNTVRQALEKMHFHRHHAVPVIDREGAYVGAVAEGDFLWELFEKGDYDLRDLERTPLAELIDRTSNPAVPSGTPITALLERVKQNAFVPVVDDRGCFIGIVTRRDVINYFIDDYLEKR